VICDDFVKIMRVAMPTDTAVNTKRATGSKALHNITTMARFFETKDPYVFNVCIFIEIYSIIFTQLFSLTGKRPGLPSDNNFSLLFDPEGIHTL